MQSLILLSHDPEKIEVYLQEIIQKEQVSKFDVNRITQEGEATKKKATKQSLGIETVKRIQEDIYLTPVQGNKRLLVIYDAHILTTEAQNALLKLLEEPPAHLIFILVVGNLHLILPTIQSRCFLINLQVSAEQASGLSEEEKTLLLSLDTKAIFELAEKKSKTKDEAVEWSKKLIEQLQQELHTQTSNLAIQQYSNLLHKLLKIHQTVSSTNISPRMTIESMLLS